MEKCKMSELLLFLSLSNTNRHTQKLHPDTHSLTLQGIFHVLSKQHPHDLSADFTHIEFLRKPDRPEEVRVQNKTTVQYHSKVPDTLLVVLSRCVYAA